MEEPDYDDIDDMINDYMDMEEDFLELMGLAEPPDDEESIFEETQLAKQANPVKPTTNSLSANSPVSVAEQINSQVDDTGSSRDEGDSTRAALELLSQQREDSHLYNFER